MVNYQNNMRYCRQGNAYQRCNSRGSNECCMPEQQKYNSCCEPRMEERRKENCCEESCRAEQRKEKCCREEFAGMPIAMAYVPWQSWCEIYDVCEGFSKGTIFRELDKRFLGKGGCNR